MLWKSKVETRSWSKRLVGPGRTWPCQNVIKCRHILTQSISVLHWHIGTCIRLFHLGTMSVGETLIFLQVGYFHAKKEISLLIRVPRSSMTSAGSFCFIGVLRFEFFKLTGLFWRMNFEELLSPCHTSNSWLRLEKGDDYPQHAKLCFKETG